MNDALQEFAARLAAARARHGTAAECDDLLWTLSTLSQTVAAAAMHLGGCPDRDCPAIRARLGACLGLLVEAARASGLDTAGLLAEANDWLTRVESPRPHSHGPQPSVN